MGRITIKSYDEYTGQTRIEGWFDRDTVTEVVDEAEDWDGNNNRGRMSGLQCGYQELLRTAGGRWVKHHDGRNEFNGPHYYEFLTDDQAREWLLLDGDEEILTKYFGEIEPERGPGRPSIDGEAINFKPGTDLLARVDAYASASSMTRAAALRSLVTIGLATAVASDSALAMP